MRCLYIQLINLGYSSIGLTYRYNRIRKRGNPTLLWIPSFSFYTFLSKSINSYKTPSAELVFSSDAYVISQEL